MSATVTVQEERSAVLVLTVSLKFPHYGYFPVIYKVCLVKKLLV